MNSFIEIGLHVFPKSGTQTHRQTEPATLYIETVFLTNRSLVWSFRQL